MTRVRRRLRLLAAAWFVLQAAFLSAFVPRDCCAAHRPVRVETEHSCHTTVAATECPMRGPDGTPCPMHRGRQSDERRTGTCAMRGTCGEPMAAMLALLSNHGVVPDSFEVLPDSRVGAAAAQAPERLIRRLTPPDPPPPRG